MNDKRTAGRFLGFAVRLDVLGEIYCEKVIRKRVLGDLEETLA